MSLCLTFFIVYISTALSLKLQRENAGTYMFIFVFIYKSPCKMFIYWLILKGKVLQIAMKQSYQIL